MEVFQSGPLCDRTMAGPLIPDDAQIRIFSAEANGGAGQDDNDVANLAADATWVRSRIVLSIAKRQGEKVRVRGFSRPPRGRAART